MNIDKSKIEYILGIDFGHGETSAAICPAQWDKSEHLLDPAKDLEMEPGRKVIPSAITITADGTAKIGTAAFDPNILNRAKVNVCFKQRPTDINGDQEQLMIRFMAEVYRKIRENNSGLLSNTNHLVYIATPSGWDKDAQAIYLQMAQKAGLPIGGVTKESRAAFVKAQHDPTANLGRNIEKGAIVFDLGSSTLDFTYHNASLANMIDNGYDCGASFIEQSIFESLKKDSEAIQKFCRRYPGLTDYLLFEVRRAKEEIYIDTTRNYKKTINFEDIIDDEDLEDERFRLKFESGQLNEFLDKNGYIYKLTCAMRDFIRNRIPGRGIYGVFLTGGASRMDFIRPLVAKCWNVSEDKIYRDTNPSLTISQGVAEVARADLRTRDLETDIKPLLRNVTGEAVYEKFVDIFGHMICKSVEDVFDTKAKGWREQDKDISLNSLTSRISYGVQDAVSRSSAHVNDIIQQAINEKTKTLQEKISAIVNAYNSQGANIKLPTLKDLEVMKGSTGIDMTDAIREISSQIETDSASWGGAVAGAAVGAIVAMLVGGPVTWIVGGAAILGAWLFGEEETEEEKREKALKKDLSKDERQKVYTELLKKRSEILASIKDTVFKSLRQNQKVRKEVTTAVDSLMQAYQEAIKKSRILVD